MSVRIGSYNRDGSIPVTSPLHAPTYDSRSAFKNNASRPKCVVGVIFIRLDIEMVPILTGHLGLTKEA